MRTVSIFKNGNNRAIRLPRDLDFDGVSELVLAIMVTKLVSPAISELKSRNKSL